MNNFRILNIFFFIFLPFLCLSQGIVYDKQLRIADSLFEVNDFEKAAFQYSRTFKMNKGRPSSKSLYRSAYSWNKIGNVDSAYLNLKKIRFEDPAITYDKIINDFDLLNFAQSNIAVKELLSQIKLNFNKRMVKTVIKGKNYNRSLLVSNPFSVSGVGFSIMETRLNGFITTWEICGNVFEMYFYPNLIKYGDSITIEIFHQAGAPPLIYNPESITDPNLETISIVGNDDQKSSYYLKDKNLCVLTGNIINKKSKSKYPTYGVELINLTKNSDISDSYAGTGLKYTLLTKFDDLYELLIYDDVSKQTTPRNKILIDLRGIPEDKKKGQVINVDIELENVLDERIEKLNKEFPVNKLIFDHITQKLKWDEDFAKAIKMASKLLFSQISQEKSLTEIQLEKELKELALIKSENEIALKNNELEKKQSSIEKQEIDKKLKEKEIKEKALVIEQERSQKRNLYIILTVIVITAFVSVFAFLRQKKLKKLVNEQKIEAEKQREFAETQKHLVEEKQKEIIDSISYAKRLQDAILPPQEFVNSNLVNNFVYYQPKDIVAGDFYWAEKVLEKFFLAAADSTGHGVPGAMVSVVCSNALNRTIKEFKLTETGKILDKTRELVLETFEKSVSEVKDGMDISLLCIDSKNKKIFWSGANNPLWYIQDAELKEIKADKQPIGKTDYPKPFTTHQIEFKENTTFYLFTDGLADQFGGPNGKKFKYKQFSDLLIKSSNLSQRQQAEIIEKAFLDWKGELEQVDDVCVIGIKI